MSLAQHRNHSTLSFAFRVGHKAGFIIHFHLRKTIFVFRICNRHCLYIEEIDLTTKNRQVAQDRIPFKVITKKGTPGPAG